MKSIDLNPIQVFVAIGQTGSFTKAAELLSVPKSFISRKILELESRLKVRLIDRTTRSVLLTEDGIKYYTACEKALEDIQDIEKNFEHSQRTPSGRLRLTCPVEFGPLMAAQMCQKFLIQYPEIQLEIISTNSVLDLVKDKVDVAVRPLQLADPSMMSLKMGELEWALYASPKWVQENRLRLEKIDSLSQLDIIAFQPNSPLQKKFRMTLYRKEKKRIIEFFPRIITSNISTLIQAAISDSGIAPLPNVLIKDHLEGHKLVRVFPEWYHRRESLVAVFANQKNTPARVRAAIDFFKSTPCF